MECEERKMLKKGKRKQILHFSLFTLHFFSYLCTRYYEIMA